MMETGLTVIQNISSFAKASYSFSIYDKRYFKKITCLHRCSYWTHQYIIYIRYRVSLMTLSFFQTAGHLIDPSFVNGIRERISPNHTNDNSYYNTVPGPDHIGTTHVSVMDEDGLAVSATSTINHLWAGQPFKQSVIIGRYSMRS